MKHYTTVMVVVLSLIVLQLANVHIAEATTHNPWNPFHGNSTIRVFGNPKPLKHSILAIITGYNTVAGQTDDTPCMAAGGWICGRTDVIACPRTLPLHTWVEVEGLGLFECMDRTASKYNGRFDISFDQDVHAALQWGKQSRIITYEGEY